MCFDDNYDDRLDNPYSTLTSEYECPHNYGSMSVQDSLLYSLMVFALGFFIGVIIGMIVC